MSILLVIVLAGIFVVAILGLFLTTPAADLARSLRRLGAVVLVLAGFGLIYSRQFGLAVPLIMGGVMLWRRDASVVGPRRPDGTRSTVRSRFLEMELDHGSGEVNGEVLSGSFAGRRLSDLDRSSLLALAEEFRSDPESLQLLESYLDRAQPGWRDDVEGRDARRGSAAPGTLGMDTDEAYEVLGLEPGASDAEIREAHRRLMKQVHPDRGGTAALAAKINEAKDQLLRRHR